MRRSFNCLLTIALLTAPTVSASAQSRIPPVEITGPQFVALSVPDLPASARWYREVFGLSVLFDSWSPDSLMHVTLLGGPTLRVELVQNRNAKPLSAYAGRPTQADLAYGLVKYGFFVRNIDSTLARLRARGATVEGSWLERPGHLPATDTLWTRNILVRDNSGTYLQFFERRN